MNILQRFILSAIALLAFTTVSFAQTSTPPEDEFVAVEKLPVVNLELLSQKIVYPDEARRNSIEGKVVIKVLIDSAGIPKKTEISTPVHPLLDSAAAQAVMSMTYTPAIANKKPIAVWLAIPVMFTLNSFLNTNTTTEPKKETPVPEPK